MISAGLRSHSGRAGMRAPRTPLSRFFEQPPDVPNRRQQRVNGLISLPLDALVKEELVDIVRQIP